MRNHYKRDIRRIEAENMMLEVAEIIYENRALRMENCDLRLRLAASEALVSSFAGHDKGEYEFLSEIIRKNDTVDLCRSAGWGTNIDRIENWEEELEKFREGRKEEAP